MNWDKKTLHEESERLVWGRSRLLIFLLSGICLWSGSASAEDNKKKGEPGVVEQVETALKNAAAKVEKGFTGAVKQVEESETTKKVGNELKRSAESLGRKVEEAGEKLKQSFKSE